MECALRNVAIFQAVHRTHGDISTFEVIILS